MQKEVKESNPYQQEEREAVLAQIAPLSTEQIHALIGEGRLSQFQLRRQADRYLLIFCILFFALVASILWHTAPMGISAPKTVLLIVAAADLWVALRAALSLWLMRQTLRHRSNLGRMVRYSDRLNRLTHRRRLWMRFILGSRSVSDKDYRRIEFFSLRLPSYAIAACLFLLIALNADKAFATTRDFVNVTTTTERTVTSICDTVGNIIQQL